MATVASLVLVAGAVVLSGGRGEPRASTASSAPPSRLFAGLPQEGIALGSAGAPATLVEFADLQCPFCGVYGRDVLPTVVDRYVRPGKLRLELQVLTFVGEDSLRAGRMAAAAAGQNRLWSFADAFYRDQGEENTGYVTDAFLQSTANAAGLDYAKAQEQQDGAAAQQVLDEAQAEAGRLGVQSTPSFLLRTKAGDLRPVEPSDLTPEAFTEALDKALAGR